MRPPGFFIFKSIGDKSLFHSLTQILAALGAPLNGCDSSLGCGRRPSPWANVKASRMTAVECCGYQTWITVKRDPQQLSALRPRAACIKRADRSRHTQVRTL